MTCHFEAELDFTLFENVVVDLSINIICELFYDIAYHSIITHTPHLEVGKLENQSITNHLIYERSIIILVLLSKNCIYTSSTQHHSLK